MAQGFVASEQSNREVGAGERSRAVRADQSGQHQASLRAHLQEILDCQIYESGPHSCQNSTGCRGGQKIGKEWSSNSSPVNDNVS